MGMEMMTCPRCQGKREIYDVTMRDYVGANGTGWVACPRCNRTGVVRNRVATKPMFTSNEPIEYAALPAWLLGEDD